MTRRRVPKRRVEKDATVNLNIAALYAAAIGRFGVPIIARQRLEALCAELEEVALGTNGRSLSIFFLQDVADDLWPCAGDERPTLEDLARTMAKISQRVREKQPLHWCGSHGWQEPAGWGRCAECPCQVPNYSARGWETGRPRAYCSNACRQRAYRRRLKERTSTPEHSSQHQSAAREVPPQSE